MRAASKVNPLTHLVDAERALFAGDIAEGAVAAGAVAAVAVATLGLVVGIKAVRSDSA